MKIGLLCPTRGRPSHVVGLIRSIEQTVQNLNNIQLYLGVDVDDKTTNQWAEHPLLKSYITMVRFPPGDGFLGLGKMWNVLAKNSSEEILAMIGDDMLFETPGWDTQIIEEFQNTNHKDLFLVHCNDMLHGPGNKFHDREPQAVNSFIFRTYYDILGYYTRDEFKHQFIDTWLNDTFKMLGRKKYLHHIKIRHNHFSQGGIYDETTKRLRDVSNYKECSLLYKNLKHEHLKEVNILKSFLQYRDISSTPVS